MQSVVHKESSLCNLPLPVFVPRRYRPGNLGTWSGHLAFADDLISAIAPSMVVELGTHYGEAYFTFCQSVAENGFSCLCYAVDHWLGEAHAGYYSEDVFQNVHEHNARHYRDFSYLLRMSFDTALGQFADQSIDLLHIDGLHTYEAVSHDFRAWFPKVKRGGIVLFHDIAVRHSDFGVWRFWDELCSEFPETFSFHHSYGLGVLRKPGAALPDVEVLQTLFRSSPDIQRGARRVYEIYASHLENEFSSKSGAATVQKPSTTSVTVYTLDRDGYSEVRSITQSVGFDRWHTLDFLLPNGPGSGPLRIDPADSPCVIEIEALSLVCENSADVLWNASDKASLDGLRCSGSATRISIADEFWIFSYGDDPQLLLPLLPETRDSVRLKIRIRLHRTLEAVFKVLEAHSLQAEPAPAMSPVIEEEPSAAIQVFLHSGGGYSEEASATQSAKLGQWQTLTFHFPQRIGPGPVRIDPADCPGVIEIADVSILAVDGAILWQANTPETLRALRYSGSVMLSSKEDKAILFSSGNDPCFMLPIIPRGDEADRVRISLCVDQSITSLIGFVSTQARCYSEEIKPLRLELSNISAERKLAAVEIAQLASERNDLKHSLKRALQNAEDHFQTVARLQEEKNRAASLAQSLESSTRSLEQTQLQLEAEQVTRHGLETSLSWRVTKPLRQMNRLIKRR